MNSLHISKLINFQMTRKMTTKTTYSIPIPATNARSRTVVSPTRRSATGTTTAGTGRPAFGHAEEEASTTAVETTATTKWTAETGDPQKVSYTITQDVMYVML